MVLKRQVLGEVTALYGLEKQGECLGADEVRGDYLMPGTDLDTVCDEVQEGGSVDHVAGHVETIGTVC